MQGLNTLCFDIKQGRSCEDNSARLLTEWEMYQPDVTSGGLDMII